MPLYRKYQQGNLIVGVWKVEETIEELYSMFRCFSIYEDSYRCFTSDKRRREWLAVRVLLKELCGEEKQVEYLPSGKPFLSDRSACISISHTGEYVAVALHPCADVAVDIEQYGEKVKKVAHKFIRDDERSSIKCDNETYALLLHWSAKETMFKLIDVDAVDFIEHLRIKPFIPSNQGVMEAEEYRTNKHLHVQIFYHTHPDYVLTYSVIPLLS